LGNDPESAAWFVLDTLATDTNTTEIRSVSTPGNFVWIRVGILEFESGTINSITLTY